MPTPLHDVDVLTTLAEGAPGPARDWANARLALRAPERLAHLPDDSWDAAVCLACPVPDAEERVLQRVQLGEHPVYAAMLVDQLLSMGQLPSEPEAWIEPLRSLVDPAGHERNLWIARALADLGALDGATLSACTRVQGAEAVAAMPGLVLRFTEAQGGDLEAVAHQIAPMLAAAVDEAPQVLLEALVHVGLPPLHLGDTDGLAAAAALGAQAADANPPALPVAKGSWRRRAQAIVRHVLADAEGAAAALLLAMAGQDRPLLWELVAHATWLANADPTGSSTTRVIRTGAGEDRVLLADARAAVGPQHALALGDSIRQTVWHSCPAAALAGPLLVGTRPEPTLIAAIRDRSLAGRGTDRRVDVLASVALATDPDQVAGLITERATRDAGLLFARYAQTEEVLRALLELPVPADPSPRFLYAWALAQMADPAVEQPLAALAARDDAAGITSAVQRAEALLGRPLSTG